MLNEAIIGITCESYGDFVVLVYSSFNDKCLPVQKLFSTNIHRQTVPPQMQIDTTHARQGRLCLNARFAMTHELVALMLYLIAFNHLPGC